MIQKNNNKITNNHVITPVVNRPLYSMMFVRSRNTLRYQGKEHIALFKYFCRKPRFSLKQWASSFKQKSPAVKCVGVTNLSYSRSLLYICGKIESINVISLFVVVSLLKNFDVEMDECELGWRSIKGMIVPCKTSSVLPCLFQLNSISMAWCNFLLRHQSCWRAQPRYPNGPLFNTKCKLNSVNSYGNWIFIMKSILSDIHLWLSARSLNGYVSCSRVQYEKWGSGGRGGRYELSERRLMMLHR